jgi:diguanylate cyclase (GGDEF)-like protein
MTENNLRILLAEDTIGEAAASLRALFPEGQRRLDLTVVSTISTLIPTISVVNPEVIFLDLSLAHPYPRDVVRRVHRSAPAVPLIVFADVADKDYAAQSLSEGALDYLLKGFMDPRTVDHVLRAALEHNTLAGLTDLLRDPLTGLYIRDGFLTLGSQAMDTANGKNSALVLLCIRIENLPAIRAKCGVSAVENSLCEFARVILGSFRRSDLVARIGESQFAALAVDAIEPSAPVLLQRLEKRIAVFNRDIGPWGPLELRLSAAFWSPEDARSFSELLDSAEAGLPLSPYRAVQQTDAGKTVTAVNDI